MSSENIQKDDASLLDHDSHYHKVLPFEVNPQISSNIRLENKIPLNKNLCCCNKDFITIVRCVESCVYKVCAGNVLVKGVINYKFYYENNTEDCSKPFMCCDVPFNSVIQVSDCSCNDKFHVTGSDILCVLDSKFSNSSCSRSCLHDDLILAICIKKINKKFM